MSEPIRVGPTWESCAECRARNDGYGPIEHETGCSLEDITQADVDLVNDVRAQFEMRQEGAYDRDLEALAAKLLRLMSRSPRGGTPSER